MVRGQGPSEARAANMADRLRAAARRATYLSALAAAAIAVPTGSWAQVPAGDLQGREIILITGSTGGLGREVALQLAGPGTHIIVHGRSIERGQEVVDELEARGSTARFVGADLGSLAQVRGLVAQIKREYQRLDLLVNNAGIGRGQDNAPRETSADGHELRFQVNYLSHFLLTRELMSLLRAGAPSRVVSVSSGAESGGTIPFDDLMYERPPYSGNTAYGRSKLAQIFMTYDLAEEFSGSGVTFAAVNPGGFLDTDMVRERGGTPTQPTEVGAQFVVNAVRSQETGAYFNEMEVDEANPQASDPAARRQLREISMQLVGLR